MKRQITNYLRNLKFRYKLMLTYLFVGVLPLIILGVFCFVQTKNLLIEREKDNIEDYLNRAVTGMDGQLKIFSNLSDYIVYSQPISQAVSKEYITYYDMYDQFSNVLDPMLASLKYFHNDVKRMTIYTRNDIVKHDTTLVPLSEIEHMPWYGEVIKDNKLHWYLSRDLKTAFSVQTMPSLAKDAQIGILYVEIDYNKLFESFGAMNENDYGLFITDEQGKLIYEYNQFMQENEFMQLNFSQFTKELNTKREGLGDYTIIKNPSSETNWEIYLYKPNKLIYRSIVWIVYAIVIVALLCILISCFAITIISKLMVKDMEALRSNMAEVEKGNMEIIVKSRSEDEIGDLIQGFGKMIHQIKVLIEEVYESRLLQKDYEMRALQAQINPHFLYNTMSMINWMALETGREDISKITLDLSTFYRTALNKGKNILSLRDELSNMKSYLHIQLAMHDYEFDVEIAVDECIMDCKIINLLLQPIIENSIEHGIDLKTDGRGRIIIGGIKVDEMILLSVEDNGVGMDSDKMEQILTNKSKGYGVRNVNERIKLYYGSEYELKVTSQLGKGTRIEVRLPIRLE